MTRRIPVLPAPSPELGARGTSLGEAIFFKKLSHEFTTNGIFTPFDTLATNWDDTLSKVRKIVTTVKGKQAMPPSLEEVILRFSDATPFQTWRSIEVQGTDILEDYHREHPAVKNDDPSIVLFLTNGMASTSDWIYLRHFTHSPDLDQDVVNQIWTLIDEKGVLPVRAYVLSNQVRNWAKATSEPLITSLRNLLSYIEAYYGHLEGLPGAWDALFDNTLAKRLGQGPVLKRHNPKYIPAAREVFGDEVVDAALAIPRRVVSVPVTPPPPSTPAPQRQRSHYRRPSQPTVVSQPVQEPVQEPEPSVPVDNNPRRREMSPEMEAQLNEARAQIFKYVDGRVLEMPEGVRSVWQSIIKSDINSVINSLHDAVCRESHGQRKLSLKDFKDGCAGLALDPETTTLKKVQKVFREKSKILHPDVNPGQEETFRPLFESLIQNYNKIRLYLELNAR